MSGAPRIYAAAAGTHDQQLRQGEILSNVVQFHLDLASLGSAEGLAGRARVHPFAILLSQDCDLEQDFKARQGGNAEDKLLPAVLFCEAVTAVQLRGMIVGSEIWKRIRANKDERYHFLQKIEKADDARAEGLPELGIDFKRYFTLPTDEAYKRLEIREAMRRSILVSPYLEHLASRFAHFQSRIALPQDHASE